MNEWTALKTAFSLLPLLLFATGCNSTSSSGSASPSQSPVGDLLSVEGLRTFPNLNQDSDSTTVPRILPVYRIQTLNQNLLRYGAEEFYAPKRRIVNLLEPSSETHRNLFGSLDFFDATTFRNENVSLIRFTDADSAGIFMDVIRTSDNIGILEVGGEQDVTLPQGRHRYSGMYFFNVYGGRHENHWGVGSDFFGNFFMFVDFSDGTDRISTGRIEGWTYGRAEVPSLDGSRLYGDVTVYIGEGTFAGNGITVENTDSGQISGVQLTGSFHGANAQGLTGLFAGPDIFGSIAGGRHISGSNIDFVNAYDNGYNLSKVETDEGVLFRFGYENETAPQRRFVLENLEAGREDVWWSTDWGDYVWNKVEVGESVQPKSLSLLKDEDIGVQIDRVSLPDNRVLLEAGGEQLSSVPKGAHNYDGTVLFSTLGGFSDNGFGTGNHLGRMSMDVNFDTGTGRVSGEAGVRPEYHSVDTLDAMEFSGDFHLFGDTGEFYGRSLTVENTVRNKEYPAVLHGNFHGEGAKAVSGVFVERSSDPNFFGAIAGALESPKN